MSLTNLSIIFLSLPQARFDIFAALIFLGVVQGIILAFFFLTGERPKNLSNLFLGLLMLSISAIILEILLCYTNYMFRVLYLIDFSEPLNYVLGPLFYFYILSKIYSHFDRRQLGHLAIFVFYFFYSLTWQIQSLNFKYNSYISAYHPDIDFRKTTLLVPNDPLSIRNHVDVQIFIHLTIYLILSFLAVRRAFQKENIDFFSNKNPGLAWLRNVVFQIFSIVLIIIFVKAIYYNDLGDYIIAIHSTLLIYLISFNIIKKSLFFKEQNLNGKLEKKYEKSSLTPQNESAILEKLEELMQKEKPYLDSLVSMPALAKKLAVPPHHLSQILNDKLNQNFFEFIAYYRIQEAQKMMKDAQFANLKIEEIAEMVGYNSKSAFHTAFKKFTKLTPSEYKKQRTNQ